MADISKIKLSDDTEYDIKDAIARQGLSTIDEKASEIIDEINNPTYTTTEGTDLTITNSRVGNMKFEFYGDTSQSGNPTPDNPIPVQSVTGANTIDIVGKNLFDNSVPINNTWINSQGALTTLNGCLVEKIQCKAGEDYTLKLEWQTAHESNNGCIIVFYDKDENMLSRNPANANATTLTITKTAPNNSDYMYVGHYLAKPITVQLEQGSTASTYEDFKSQSFELNLGKNVLENKNKNVVLNGITFTLNNDGSILVNGTATGNAAYYFGVNNGSYLQKIDKTKTYSLSIGKNTFPFQAFLRISDSNNSGLFKQCQNAYGTNSNKVENIEGSFFESGVIIGQLFIYSGAVCNNFRVYPQLEIGASASDYAPYLLPIKLVKNGDHQDYLYNNGSKWIKHTEVGKSTQNGSETWTLNSSTTDYYEFIRYGLTPLAVTGYVNAYTEYFSNLSNNRCITNGQAIYIRVPASAGITTANDFATWLSTHNTDIYYQLATPIEEEITDLVTLNYLNNIKYGAKSYYGTTNITITSSELQPIMKVQTLNKIV